MKIIFEIPVLIVSRHFPFFSFSRKIQRYIANKKMFSLKNIFAFLLAYLPVFASAQTVPVQIEQYIAKQQKSMDELYRKLHASPELSTMETATAAFLQESVRGMGYRIIDSLGFHSFAAVLENGKGPVILYRTDMDGLPVKEMTGLPYASQVQMQKGNEMVPVMHACGHDLHMSSWLTVARLMSDLRKQWSGTLVLLAQSAEETGQGAKKAVASPAFAKIPKPDLQLAMHDHFELPAGVAGFCDEYSMAAVDMMNITVRGKGGHGAVPQQAIDPVVLASQYVLAIQQIVSRNLSPNDPAVITVGAINGGTAGNVIPDQVELKLTIRSYSAASRQLILDRLKTIGDNLALSAGLDKDHLPVYDLLDMTIPSVYNDPKLGARLRDILNRTTGGSSVATVKPVMIGEDFGVYGQQASHIPSYLLWIGTVSPERKALADQGKTELYTLHSAKFAPDHELAVPGAVRIMANCLMELMKK